MRIFKGFATSISFLWLLAACSQLPRSGPESSTLLAGEGQRHNLAMVEIDPATISLLSANQEPTLLGAFGDYRPPADQKIGVGDMLQITLWESSGGGLFSNPATDRSSAGSHSAAIPDQTVSRDGAITVPFAGRVPVVGRTPFEVERVIIGRLADKAIDPQALVSITRNVSNMVTSISEGGVSARVPLSLRGDKLLEVIAQSGGIRTAASDTSVVLSRGTDIVRVPLEAVLHDPREDIFLQAGDVVTQIRDPQTFTAVGATGRNNVVSFDSTRLTLDEALGKAGGLLDERADPAGLFVIRFETGDVAQELSRSHGVPLQGGGVPAIYHLDMREPTAFFLARNFSMRNKDIIYVADARYTDIQKMFALLNLLVTPAITGLTIQNSIR